LAEQVTLRDGTGITLRDGTAVALNGPPETETNPDSGAISLLTSSQAGGAIFHFDSGFIDYAGLHWVNVNGGVIIDASQKQFGTASARFDGGNSTTWLTLDSGDDFAFGTADFTIDFWIRVAAFATFQVLLDFRTALNSPCVFLELQSGKLEYYVAGAYRISTAAISGNVFHHIALTRSGISTRLFIDGVQGGTTWTADATNYQASSSPVIGNSYSPSSAFSGWLDELRIAGGYCAWSANFTPPALAYAGLPIIGLPTVATTAIGTYTLAPDDLALAAQPPRVSIYIPGHPIGFDISLFSEAPMIEIDVIAPPVARLQGHVASSSLISAMIRNRIDLSGSLALTERK
jgi:hypothetical protein